ncbi:hypothetical protein ACFLZK_01150 [Patescibacteria group bacterium]
MQPSSVRKGSVTVHTKKMIESDLRNVDVLLKGKKPSQLRQALITTDKALDNALKDVVIGENMGERLKNASELFDRDLYNKIWSAHKMRNSVVHESGYEPPYHMVTQGIDNLKKGLRTLGVN